MTVAAASPPAGFASRRRARRSEVRSSARRRARWLGALLCFSPAACGEATEVDPQHQLSNINHCREDGDCTSGSCDAAHELCVAPSEIGAAVLEFTPPATDAEFGGFAFYRLLDDLSEPAPDVGTTAGGQRFELRVPPSIEGEVTLALGSDTCPQSEVEISFVPVEASLGIAARHYSVRSSIVRVVRDRRPVNLNTYRLAGLPSGRYDLYVKDAGLIDHSANPECAVVPQVYRDQEIRLREGQSSLRLDLVLPQPDTLQVFVPWHDDLESWTADIIHAQTGERLSSVGVLSGDNLQQLQPVDDEDPQPNAVVTLRWSRARGTQARASELLRLRPPPQSDRPTVLWQLSALQLFEDDEALVPSMSPFNRETQYEAWVLGPNEERFDGYVRFSALRLLDVPQAVIAQLRKTVEIGEAGLVEARLPAGDYQVQVMPRMADAALAPALEQAAFETEIRVLELPDGDVQAGQVIAVPPPVSVSGRVAFNRALPAAGTLVQLEAAAAWRAGDLPLVGGFRPRHGDAIADPDGQFEVMPVDCGHCASDAPGARYSLVVRSPAGAGVPWLVVPELEVRESLDVGTLQIGLPSVYGGRLSHRGRAFAGVRVRAYVLLDQFGEVVNDVELGWCSRLGLGRSVESARCVAQALPVAQTRSGADGSFRLLIPQSVGQL